MSIRFLLIAAPILAICAAHPHRLKDVHQRSSRDLETMILNNTVELDKQGGTFRLDWDLVYDQDATNPQVVLEMRVATRGWFSLRFTSADLSLGDYFYGAYDADRPSNSFFLDKHCELNNGRGCETADGPKDDLRNDFQLISIVFGQDYTLMRIARLADTGHLQDVAITPSPMMIGWFWSAGIWESGQLTPIDKMGFQDVVLIPE
ncbi:Uncharacterized protein APZ42_030759 [Daphnia magna]|uniref:DOMON domain-containing protein n=1 Tax=Daphnia magna TaxID=35525 RepID=A0A164NAI5_9CRUS|nr:Uncharacterized protein APZ42_030759 [Daphnia magna]